MFQITVKELYLCLPEVILPPHTSPTHPHTQGHDCCGKGPGVAATGCFHLEREEIHLSPFWVESLSVWGLKSNLSN